MLRKKPWGHEIVANGPEGYALKIITVDPGCRTSLQRHTRKHETYYFLEVGDDAFVEIDDRMFTPVASTFVVIPPTTVHRVTGYVRYVEASTEEIPDDIERLADDYGRAP